MVRLLHIELAPPGISLKGAVFRDNIKDTRVQHVAKFVFTFIITPKMFYVLCVYYESLS